MAGPEAAKEVTEHQTNKAFERYCQFSGQRAHAMAKVIRQAQGRTKVKVATLKNYDFPRCDSVGTSSVTS